VADLILLFSFAGDSGLTSGGGQPWSFLFERSAEEWLFWWPWSPRFVVFDGHLWPPKPTRVLPVNREVTPTCWACQAETTIYCTT